MKQFFVTLTAVIVAMLIVLIGLPIALIVGAVSASKPAVSGDVVVSVDLREPLTDQSAPQPFDFITGRGLSTMDVVTTLHRAANDSHVKAVFIRLPEGGMSPAAAEEIRRAVIFLRGANKPVIAHSQGLYPDTMVIASYLVGSSASELWMQPHSSFQVTGIASSTLFFSRAFEKFGIKPEFEQRYEYKNAVNPYLYNDFTPEHREATLSWMDSIYDSMLTAIAKDRRMEKPQVKALLEAGPYSAAQALDLGLVGKLGQVREAEQAALRRGEKAKIIDLRDYARVSVRPPRGAATIAVINGEGAIMTGTSGSGGGFGSDPMMMSDDVSKAFYDAIADKNVKAIVFRVSSPGGSDTASEQIAQAIKAAKEAGKPVVVSMGEYAASGGYWISSGATAIVTNPSTLTGSIGVYGGKFNIGDGLASVGVDMRDISVGGEYATAYNAGENFSPEQRAAISGWIDQIYDGFIVQVASSRNIPEDRVREIAKGRVWTGQQALELRLADRIGGFYDAVDEAKIRAGIDSRTEVRLVYFPVGEQSGIGSLAQSARMSATGLRVLSMLGWAMSDPRAEAVMNRVADERLRADGATVLAPAPYEASSR